MGCCESCSLPPVLGSAPASNIHFSLEEAVWEPSAPHQLSSFILSPLLSPLIEDSHTRDIIALVETLQDRTDWKTHTQDSICVVKSLPVGAGFVCQVPVFAVEIRLEERLQAEDVLRVLYSPTERLKWDQGVLMMEEKVEGENVWLVYSVSKLPFPLKNRDFSEKRVLVENSQAAVVVQYSLTAELGGWAVTPRYERAEVLFSLLRVEPQSSHTLVQLTSQCDLKLPVTLTQVTSPAAVRMKAWAHQLHSQLASLHFPSAYTKNSAGSYMQFFVRFISQRDVRYNG